MLPIVIALAIGATIAEPSSATCRAVRVDARTLGAGGAFFGAAAAGYEGRVFLFGGHGSSGGISNALRSYNVKTRVIEKVKTTGAPLTGRRYVGAAVVGDALYLVGGQNNAGRLKTVERVDLKTFVVEALPPLPTTRAFAGVAAYNGKLWVAGGEEADKTRTTRVDIYDPVNRTWRVGPPLKHARDGRLVVLDGVLWALPGFDGAKAVPFLERLDKGVFIDVDGAPATSAFGAAVVNDNAVLFGDYDAQSDVRTFSPTRGWSVQHGAIVARRHAAVAAVDGVIVVAGGNRRPDVKTAQPIVEAFAVSCDPTPMPCEAMRASDDTTVLAQHDRLCGVGYGVAPRLAKLLSAKDPVAAARVLAASLTSASQPMAAVTLAVELADASPEARAVLMALGRTEENALMLPVSAQKYWRAHFSCPEGLHREGARQGLTRSNRDRWVFQCADQSPGVLWFDFSTLNPSDPALENVAR